MPIDVGALCDDLMLETAALHDVLRPLDETAWSAPTPAAGWSVRDQVTHLAYFDEVSVRSALDPDVFCAERVEALADIDGYTGMIAARYAAVPGSSVLRWFGGARQRFVDVFGVLDARMRVPWYGVEMSVASTVTARVMETWAHGQDVVDALGVERRPTPALRHVAHLGVRTFANSFTTRERDVPGVAVRVELTSPDGATWEWGPPAGDGIEVVRGSALDFCLVVTQRRHVNDTALEVEGDVAAEWMSIAQAFAGPAGAGRAPGEFAGR